MFSKGRKAGTSRFSIQPGPEVQRAYVAGDFTGWNPHRMRKQKNGEFVAVLPLKKGAYEYKFLLDDKWIADPDNSAWSKNEFGSINSVAEVS